MIFDDRHPREHAVAHAQHTRSTPSGHTLNSQKPNVGLDSTINAILIRVPLDLGSHHDSPPPFVLPSTLCSLTPLDL
jgi:hypothetical protein